MISQTQCFCPSLLNRLYRVIQIPPNSNVKHILITLFVLISIICLPFSTYGQADSIGDKSYDEEVAIPKISLLQWLGNNLNPGVKIGLGGSHNMGYYPNANLKLGITSWQSGSFKGKDFSYESYQINVDFFCWDRSHQHHRDYVTLSKGYTGKYSNKNSNKLVLDYQLVGWSRYYIDRRASFYVKIGMASRESRTLIENKRVTEISGGFYGDIGFNYSLFRYRRKPTHDETKRLYSKVFNPYVSLGLGADRVILFPAFGFKFFDANIQMAYGRFNWHNYLSGSIEYLLPGGKEFTKDGIRKLSIQATVLTDIDGGLSHEMFSFQFGRTQYFINNNKSRFLRFGIGLIDQTGSSSRLILQPFPVLTLGYAFHVFPFYKKDFLRSQRTNSQYK
jgi:hypothetical protein